MVPFRFSAQMDKFLIRKGHIRKSGETSRSRTSPAQESTSTSTDDASIQQSTKTNDEKEKRQEFFQQAPSDLGHEYPKQPKHCTFKPNQVGRKFNPEWYRRFEWLEYSVQRDAAFCYPCRKFAPHHVVTENKKRFTVHGFFNWKRAVGDKEKGLLQHDNCTWHNEAMARWKEKLIRTDSGKSVSLMVSADVLEKRRYYVRSIAEVVKFLAVNELPFRGTYDLTQHEEGGLFNRLLSYTLTKDQKLAEIERTIPRNATLRSPEVQNDIIKLMARMVSEAVAADLKSSPNGRFTLLADGTRNKANVENIACAVRYVNDGVPKESLLVIKSTEKLDAKALTDVLLDSLDELEVDTSKMLSQCYDGASSMSGDRGGVQRLIQNTLHREIPYVHCNNHKLHLVVIDLVSSSPQLSEFFDQLKLLSKFFSKFKVDKTYKGHALKRVLDTRWSGHYDATVAVVDNFDAILCALQEISDNDSPQVKFDVDTVATATGLRKFVTNERFMFIAVLMKRVLGLLKPADSVLQARETDLNEALKVVDTSISLLKSLRSEKGYLETVEKMKVLSDTAESHTSDADSLSLTKPKRKRSINARLDGFIITERVRIEDHDQGYDDKKSIYFTVIDRINAEMKERFTDNCWLYKAIRTMSRTSPNFLERDDFLPLSEHLGLDIPSAAEVEVAKEYLKSNVPIAGAQDSNIVLQSLYEQKSAFPKLYNLASDIATFGSSSAVCESGFSTLTRVDKPTRRSMSQPRQACLVLLAFEHKITARIDLDCFVRRLAVLHPRLQLV